MTNAEFSLNLFEVKSIISQFVGQSNVIGCPAVFKKWLGNYNTAIMLSQIIYWSERTNDEGGWFYKKYSDWDGEICLSENEARNAINKLKRSKIIETKIKKIAGIPTMHIRLNTENFYKKFSAFLQKQMEEVRISQMEMVIEPDGNGYLNTSEMVIEPLPISSQEITSKTTNKKLEESTHTHTSVTNPHISEKEKSVCVCENESAYFDFIQEKILHIPPIQYQQWQTLINIFIKRGLNLERFTVFWKWFRENPEFAQFRNHSIKPENLIKYLPVWLDSLKNNGKSANTTQRNGKQTAGEIIRNRSYYKNSG